jgi:hypothetical protein
MPEELNSIHVEHVAETEGHESQEESKNAVSTAAGGNPSEEFTGAEEQVFQALRELGIEYREANPFLVIFARRTDRSWPLRSDAGIPRTCIPDLGRQIENGITHHPTSLGFMVPALGYSEILLRGYGRIPTNYTLERIFRYGHDPVACRHKEQDKQLYSVPYEFRRERERADSRIHVSSSADGTCIEISNASPLGMLLYSAVSFDKEESRFTPTVKIDFGKQIEGRSIVAMTDKLIRSLIYELDVRNGLVLGVRSRPLPRESRDVARRSRPRIEKIRYPRIRIEHEASDLFNFAGQAEDNPPLSFLSYYQTLEYFVPAAVRQNALKRIRRELQDPAFNEESDISILRIVSATERSINTPEAAQLRTLVNEFVRKDRLVEFFHEEWGDYFTRRGPIQGAEAINPGNSSNLCDQVADRVYQIRNRIVHAKDDPRYQDARVLLPQSQEAQSLGPDVELVRLLAMEAILGNQGPAV